jgi:hypothetical protein
MHSLELVLRHPLILVITMVYNNIHMHACVAHVFACMLIKKNIVCSKSKIYSKWETYVLGRALHDQHKGFDS